MMSDIKIKLCGFTCEDDVKRAVALDVDFIGFIIDVPIGTPRNISLRQAVTLKRLVPDDVATVAVLMPKTASEVRVIEKSLYPDRIQLHGHESLAFVEEIRDSVSCQLIKACHANCEDSIDKATQYAQRADYLLIDTKLGDKIGGTGQPHDWDVSSEIKDAIAPTPMFLSGGLTPENVATAVERVNPYAVDAASGIEREPGKKDPDKMQAFVEAVRG